MTVFIFSEGDSNPIESQFVRPRNSIECQNRWQFYILLLVLLLDFFFFFIKRKEKNQIRKSD